MADQQPVIINKGQLERLTLPDQISEDLINVQYTKEELIGRLVLELLNNGLNIQDPILLDLTNHIK